MCFGWFSRLLPGFKCWDAEETGININEELAQIANRASLGEDGANGTSTVSQRVVRTAYHNVDCWYPDITRPATLIWHKIWIYRKRIWIWPPKWHFYNEISTKFKAKKIWILSQDIWIFTKFQGEIWTFQIKSDWMAVCLPSSGLNPNSSETFLIIRVERWFEFCFQMKNICFNSLGIGWSPLSACTSIIFWQFQKSC